MKVAAIDMLSKIRPENCKRNKYRETKRMHENRDSYRFYCNGWSQVYNPLKHPIRSEIFSLRGHSWLLEVYTSGTHEKSEHVAFRLVNMSDVEMLASYTVSLISHFTNSKCHSWTDPDGIVTFQPHGSGDDSWGPDEYILINYLKNPNNGFYENDSVIFDIEICAYGEELDSMVQQVVVNKKYATLATTNTDLMEQDLADIIIQPFGKLDIRRERMKQDNLIWSRVGMPTSPVYLPPATATTTASTHNSVFESSKHSFFSITKAVTNYASRYDRSLREKRIRIKKLSVLR